MFRRMIKPECIVCTITMVKSKEFKDKEDAIKYATDNHDELMEKVRC